MRIILRVFPALVILVIIIFLSGSSPEKQETRTWFKGNLHTHSYWSDGDEFPEMIMDWYKSHGYHFVGLSDHNTLARGEKWKKIQQSKLYEDGFANYLARFGSAVVYRNDSGRTNVKLKPYAEYKSLFEDSHFIVIPSEEVTTRLGDKPIHMNVTNIQKIIAPQAGTSVLEIMQHTVDAVNQQRKETGISMFPHINHPNFYYGVSLQDIIDLRGERFFEVYNGHPLVHNYGDSLHPGTEEMWDKINIAYLNKNLPLMYGLATDDSHNYHQFGAAYSNAGRGWVMVQADSLKPTSIINAMEAGNFYASTGVTLEELGFTSNTLNIRVKAEAGIKYVIEFIGVNRNENRSHVLKKVSGTAGVFRITSQYSFVRARVTSTKLKQNPFQEGDFEMAWTQPVVYK